jgi:hypothetical protein
MPAPKIHSGYDRRNPFARRTSATMIASWTFLIRHGPAAARFTLRHTLSGYTPGLRLTGENISNPDAAKVSFPEAEISSFALSAPPPRGASLRASLGGASLNWDRFLR